MLIAPLILALTFLRSDPPNIPETVDEDLLFGRGGLDPVDEVVEPGAVPLAGVGSADVDAEFWSEVGF